MLFLQFYCLYLSLFVVYCYFHAAVDNVFIGVILSVRLSVCLPVSLGKISQQVADRRKFSRNFM